MTLHYISLSSLPRQSLQYQRRLFAMQSTPFGILCLFLLLLFLIVLYVFAQICCVWEELGLTSEKFRKSSLRSKIMHVAVAVLVTVLHLVGSVI
jgi:hypothetical protein